MSRLVRLWAFLIAVLVGTGMSLASPSAYAAPPAKPVVTAVTPSTGTGTGAVNVLIQGKHLTGARAVLFGQTPGTDLIVVSDKQVKVVAPAHAVGDVEVVVRTDAGLSASSVAGRFTYSAPVSGPSPLSLAVNIALHVLLLGSLLAFLVGLLATAFYRDDKTERVLRLLAIFGGAMVAVGAQASGLDYATYMADVLANARGASAAAHLATTIVPAAAGAGIGFFIIRAMRQESVLAIRVMGFVGMLAVTSFLQVYAEAASLRGFNLGAAALPNIAFSTGVILVIIFTHKTEAQKQKRKSSVVGRLAEFLLNRPSPTEQRVRDQKSPPAEPRHDPFLD